jgi:hypothetical protein
MSFVFLYKIREQEGGTGPAWAGWGVITSRRGRRWRKVMEGEHSANTLHTGM